MHIHVSAALGRFGILFKKPSSPKQSVRLPQNLVWINIKWLTTMVVH